MADLCEVCGERETRYICRACGRRVCENCFDQETWLCRLCSSEARTREPASSRALAILALGIMLTFVGLVVLVAGLASSATEAAGGAFVLVGPFPLVVTFDKAAPLLFLLIPVLFVVLPFLFCLFWLRRPA